MTDPKPSGDAKLDAFAEKLRQAEANLQGDHNNMIAEVNRDSGIAWRVMVDIVAGPAVGLLIGYALDQNLGTSPLFILVCFFLGMGGGFLNAYKTSMKKNAGVGFKKED